MSTAAEAELRELRIKNGGLRVLVGKLLDRRDSLVAQRTRALGYLERRDLSAAKMVGLVAATLKEHE